MRKESRIPEKISNLSHIDFLVWIPYSRGNSAVFLDAFQATFVASLRLFLRFSWLVGRYYST